MYYIARNVASELFCVCVCVCVILSLLDSLWTFFLKREVRSQLRTHVYIVFAQTNLYLYTYLQAHICFLLEISFILHLWMRETNQDIFASNLTLFENYKLLIANVLKIVSLGMFFFIFERFITNANSSWNKKIKPASSQLYAILINL